MSREEIIAMAKEARISEMGLNIDGSIHLLGLFERFAALVAAKAAAAERETCACIALINGKDAPTQEERDMAWAIALAIRARSKA